VAGFAPDYPLTNALIRTNYNLQIIILEHAGPSIWSNFEATNKVARWRKDEKEKALVPNSWFE
jgi:hypothetical protein